MPILPLQILTFVIATHAFMCPAPEVCKCNDIFMTCICDDQQEITLNAVLSFDIKHVIVANCEYVVVPLGAMTHLQLETIVFRNLSRLNIHPFAFAGIQTITLLSIMDVDFLDIQSHGFSGLYNVSRIFLSNVKGEDLPTGAFNGLSDIEHFTIENAHFQFVEQVAFILTHVATFQVINSTFHSLENNSFYLHNSEIVSFQDSSFYETSTNSFTTAFVGTLAFRNCEFGIISETTFVAKSLETFIFENCTVGRVETDAFVLLEVTENVYFTNNTVMVAESNSLIPNEGLYISKNSYIDVTENRLTCDCGIAWIWDFVNKNNTRNRHDLYKEFRENNSCIPDNKTALSSLYPLRNDSTNCILLAERQTIEILISYGSLNHSSLIVVIFILVFFRVVEIIVHI